MTMHPGESRLNDWIDGELDAEAAAQVAAHVESCAACRADADALTTLLERAAAVHDSIEPARDLWSGIEARIDDAGTVDLAAWRTRRRGTLWTHRYELAAAATLLVLLASTGTYLLARNEGSDPPVAVVDDAGRETTPVRRDPTTTPVHADPTTPVHADPTTPVQLVAVPGQADYSTAIRQLDALLREREDRLDPHTVDVVRQNMAIIDEAIRQAQAALASDPANADLNRAVSSAYKARIHLLRRAVELPART